MNQGRITSQIPHRATVHLNIIIRSSHFQEQCYSHSLAKRSILADMIFF